MHVIDEFSDKGVVERRFDFTVDGELVPGIQWSPEGARGPRPLVLIGHGGWQHKRVAGVISLARGLAREAGYTAVAIDAPAHGERVHDREEAADGVRRFRRRIAAGPGGDPGPEMTPEQARRSAEGRTRAINEWRHTIDVLHAEGLVADGRIGYCGFSMGTAIGLPLAASEPRVRVAVLGLSGLPPGPSDLDRAARALTIPVLFVFQWDDELIPREAGLRLFDAIGSSEKTMHIHPGGHLGTPPYQRRVYMEFLQRHLGA